MNPEVDFKEPEVEDFELDETIEEITCNGKYKLFIENPKTPQDAFMNDIFISLQQVKAGDVHDADDWLRQLRAELELDSEERESPASPENR